MLSETLRTFKLFCATVAETVLAPAAGELKQYDLTATQYVALRYLRLHERPTGGDMAAGLGISNAAATKLIDRLEGRGLVQRGHDPADRRAMRLELTPQGKRIAAEAADVERDRLKEVLERMPEAQAQSLERSMKAFMKAALTTPEMVNAVCLRCGREHLEDCPGNQLYFELTGRRKEDV